MIEPLIIGFRHLRDSKGKSTMTPLINTYRALSRRGEWMSLAALVEELEIEPGPIVGALHALQRHSVTEYRKIGEGATVDYQHRVRPDLGPDARVYIERLEDRAAG
jgi:hypothetical protein